jgi:hypothetical protein
MHSDEKIHRRTALIIRSSIRKQYYETDKYQREYLQVTSIVIEDWNGCITISIVYSLLKHTIKREHCIAFFKILDIRFIAVGDYNAKHMHWESRSIPQAGTSQSD